MGRGRQPWRRSVRNHAKKGSKVSDHPLGRDRGQIDAQRAGHASRQLRAKVLPELRVERFLEFRDSRIKAQDFGGKRMLGRQIFSTTDARVVLGPANLCGYHFRRGADPTTSLYQAGWYRLANSWETSPRITEPNAPRSANTLM